jgi:O-antigen ligase
MWPAPVLIGFSAASVLLLTFATWRRFPELPIIIYFAVAADLFGLSAVADTRLAVGGVKPWDWALLYSVSLALWRATLAGRRDRSTPVSFWLWIGAGVVSAVLALANDVPPLSVGNETRRVAAYLVYPVTLLLVRDRQSLRRLLLGLAATGTVVAVLAIVESVGHGDVAFMSGKLNPSAEFTGVIYVANFFVAATFVACFAWGTLAWRDLSSLQRLVVAAAWTALAAGIVVTLRRNLWIASSLSLLIFAVVAGRRVGTLFWTTVVTSAALLWTIAQLPAVSLALADSPALHGVIGKLSQFTDPVYQAGSLTVQVRLAETEYALAAIRDHPMLGIGLGNTYYTTTLHQMLAAQPQWIHNGYLWVAMKVGLPGLAALLAFVGRAIFLGFSGWAHAKTEGMRALMLSCAIALLTLVASSVAEPVLMDVVGASTIAVLAGVIDRGRIFDGPRAPVASPRRFGNTASTRHPLYRRRPL